jgi:FixJ family two-component response regulator
VDDDDVARAELSQYLSSSGFSVRAFRSAESFLEQRRPVPGPACLVLDYHLPGLSGLELQKRLSASAVSVVFVTASGDVSTVVEAMKGGAVDFLTKPVDFAHLEAAVTRGLERSERTETERRLHDLFVERMDRLTRREREVVTGLIRGLANKEIASELGATEKTIKVHRGRVMAKLEVGSVAELVRLVEEMIDATAPPPFEGLFETRRLYSSVQQPKWRSTC